MKNWNLYCSHTFEGIWFKLCQNVPQDVCLYFVPGGGATCHIMHITHISIMVAICSFYGKIFILISESHDSTSLTSLNTSMVDMRCDLWWPWKVNVKVKVKPYPQIRVISTSMLTMLLFSVFSLKNPKCNPIPFQVYSVFLAICPRTVMHSHIGDSF